MLHLEYTVATAGNYYLEVTASGTSGDYLLTMSGNTVTPPAFQATAITPANGALINVQPTTVTVDFNHPVYAPSVSAADLLVDGVAIATGVTQVDADTFSFTLPGGFGQGVHTLSLAAGSIADLQQTPLDAFSSSFTFDSIAPRVIATSMVPGDVAAPGNFSYQVTFSEPVKTNMPFAFMSANISPKSNKYSSFSLDATGTVLTVNFTNLPEDNYTLTLDFVTDLAGNAMDGEFNGTLPSGDGVAGGSFVTTVNLDLATEPFGTPLSSETPSGSLIYDATITRRITYVGDTDSFTINLDAGQTLSAVVHPTATGLMPSISISDPNNVLLGSNTAAAAGREAILQTLMATSAGTYTVTVSNSGVATGDYTLQLIANAAVESEFHGGAYKQHTVHGRKTLTPVLSVLVAHRRVAVVGRALIHPPWTGIRFRWRPATRSRLSTRVHSTPLRSRF